MVTHNRTHYLLKIFTLYQNRFILLKYSSMDNLYIIHGFFFPNELFENHRVSNNGIFFEIHFRKMQKYGCCEVMWSTVRHVVNVK